MAFERHAVDQGAGGMHPRPVQRTFDQRLLRTELSAGGVTQRRQVMPTRSYLSQVERTLTFGLGTADRVDSLKVIWSDGSEQVVEVDEVDVLRVIE